MILMHTHMLWLTAVQTRVTIVEFLQQRGLFRGITDNTMRLAISSRSKDVIEPVLKPQWWVACKGMADASCEAVRKGDLEIVPKVSRKDLSGQHEVVAMALRCGCCISDAVLATGGAGAVPLP